MKWSFTDPPTTGTLTESQQTAIDAIVAVEEQFPKFTPAQIGFMLSQCWWGSALWKDNGKSSWTGLVLQYNGGLAKKAAGSCHQVNTDHRKRLRGGVTDKSGRRSGISHTFPAIAVAEDRTLGTKRYGVWMITSVGDFMQNTGRL